MNIRAVSRSKEEKEINTHNFAHKTMEGTMMIVNGVVDHISLSIEGVDADSGRKPRRISIFDLELAKAKSLYLVLRSMLSILGELEKLDECIL